MSLHTLFTQTPILGYGCYALSGAYGTPPDNLEATRLLHAAYELGIRFFDTADGYGNTEELLAKALGHCRKDIFVATKIGPGTLSRDRVVSACENSLRNLKTDYIDLYQIHYDDPQTPVAETMGALEELREAGKIRSYGLGHLSPSRLKEYLKIGSPAAVLVEMNALVLARYAELRPLQQDSGFSLIAFSATARGLLTGKVTEHTIFGPDDIRRLDPQFRGARKAMGLSLAREFERIGARFGKTSGQLAIAWVLTQPGIDVALVGPTNIQHLHENCAVLNWRLDQTTLSELDALVQNHSAIAASKIEEEVRNILLAPLNANDAEAAMDLIYALEFLAERSLMSEEECYRMFRQLVSVLRGKPSTYLRAAQQTMRAVIS